MIRYVKNRENIYGDRWIKIFSLFLSVSYIVSSSYCKYDSAKFLLEDRFQMLLSAMCIIGYYLIIYYVLCLLVVCIEKNVTDPTPLVMKDQFFQKHMWCAAFLIILLCWIPWILMNYPGTSEPDSVYQMKQYMGDEVFTAHHPPLSTVIRGTLFVIGKSVWKANFGFFLYIALQTFLGALIFSWSIHEIHKLGVRCSYCFVAVLYYAVLPMWGGAMQGDGKDILYTEFAALFVTCLVKIIVTKQCGKLGSVLLTVAGILTALLRNNGIYAVLPTILVLLCYLKNVERKKMWVILCAVSLVYYGVTNIVYPGVGIKEASIREALSIPFLQTARYVNTYEEEVTEYEKEVIGSVLEYDALKTYNPKHADSVKNTYKGDDSKLPEYFMELGVDHIFEDRFADIFVEIEYVSMEMPVIRYFSMAGTYTWIMLICIMLLLREKIYCGMILFVPEIMNVLVCIASPTWHIRYALPVMAVVPLMIGGTFCLVSNKMAQRIG